MTTSNFFLPFRKNPNGPPRVSYIKETKIQHYMKHFEEIIKEKTPTLVAFAHAGKQDVVDVKSLTDELRKKYAGKANIVEFDNSFNNYINHDFRITAYPCYILFKEGQELMRESGKKTITELSELVERAL